MTSAPLFACFALIEGSTPDGIYRMDLFSLISFGVGIAGLIVALFLGWLSWQFYVKSKEAAEQAQQALIKIESTVASVQTDITEIVKRAVSFWTDSDGASSGVVDADSDLSKRVDELSNQILSLSETGGSPDSGISEKLEELLKLQREQLSSAVVDAKAKALFPSIDKGPAVQVTQNIHEQTVTSQSGELIVEVLRRVSIASATGQFDPIFAKLPKLDVKLLTSPTNLVSISSGLHGTGSFNVHLISKIKSLETGTYVIKYSATA